MTDSIEFPVEGITDRSIRIRLGADADTAAIVAACQDPEIPRWTRVPEPYDEETAAEWAVESKRQQESGTGLHLVIVDAETDDILGSIGIQEIERDEGRCDIGYFLAPEARRRGVMTSAVRLLGRWVFDNLPVERVQIKIQQQNAASRAVAERAGYTFEGVLRSHTVIKGRRCDMAMYSLLRRELQ
ncbi:MAG TPA: GNAT family N-acetyltransferase [Agromyces sp.]|nr:GNAT family N-acetyltransferase [Agromyces sp.]